MSFLAVERVILGGTRVHSGGEASLSPSRLRAVGEGVAG